MPRVKAPTDAQRSQSAPVPIAPGPSPKLGQTIAQLIEQDIMERGWPLGEVLGSEAELIERFGVSRAAFREATRILEDHQTAVMRRGRGGGLIVTAPDSASVARVSALYLDYARISEEQLIDARTTVELRIVDLGESGYRIPEFVIK